MLKRAHDLEDLLDALEEKMPYNLRREFINRLEDEAVLSFDAQNSESDLVDSVVDAVSVGQNFRSLIYVLNSPVAYFFNVSEKEMIKIVSQMSPVPVQPDELLKWWKHRHSSLREPEEPLDDE